MIWIDRQPELDASLERVAAQPQIAVDTEADSLHSYFDKVCLIQLSTPEDDLVIDPLTKIDLRRFGEILADANVTKVLHGADYDLRILNRDFGFEIRNVVDTMVCAQLLGYSAFGLAALLERHFGLKLDKRHQRADWSMRPLPPDMLEYATTDTHHLLALAAKLREELLALGRWDWAVEEFSRLEAIRFREADEDSERFRKLKGIGGLERRQLAALAALHAWRDRLAREADRPPFKIIGNDALVEIAKAMPRSREELAKIPAVSRYHSGRFGNDILGAVKRALALPESELPEKGETKAWIRDRVLEARVERLKKVRDGVASKLGIDSSVLSPRHVLTTIATMMPTDPAQLAEVPAMRNWQRGLLGEPFVEALASMRN